MSLCFSWEIDISQIKSHTLDQCHRNVSFEVMPVMPQPNRLLELAGMRGEGQESKGPLAGRPLGSSSSLTLCFSVGSESGHWAPHPPQSARHFQSVYASGSSGLESLGPWGWRRLTQQGFFSRGSQVPKPGRGNPGCWAKEAEGGPCSENWLAALTTHPKWKWENVNFLTDHHQEVLISHYILPFFPTLHRGSLLTSILSSFFSQASWNSYLHSLFPLLTSNLLLIHTSLASATETQTPRVTSAVAALSVSPPLLFESPPDSHLPVPAFICFLAQVGLLCSQAAGWKCQRINAPYKQPSTNDLQELVSKYPGSLTPWEG